MTSNADAATVERAARGIYAAKGYGYIWEDHPCERVKERCIEQAQAALAASGLLEENARLKGVVVRLASIPAVEQVLGRRHTKDCSCPLCEARAIMAEGNPQEPTP